MSNFEPWKKYPDLTRDRLSVIATMIRDVRHGCVLLHDPDEGDGPWSLGCRAYERICHAIRKASLTYNNWLKILPEKSSLGFSFAIGNVPFRFYRGDPEEPPSHYQSRSYGEIRQIQLCLALDMGDIQSLDGVLRLAVEITDLEVSAVTLVEMDGDGSPIDSYQIPFDEGDTNLVSIEAPPPIVTPPAIAEPLQKEEEKKEDDEKRERGHGIGSGS